MTKTFSIKSKAWVYPGDAPWHFVTIPKKTTEEINFYFAHAKRGWGSLRVTATVGSTIWQTSIFPDKRTSSFMLPLKKEVRTKESIITGKTINISLELSD